MIKYLPNTITCLNLFSGCIGVVFAFNHNLIYAGYAILLSAFLDFFDGMAARMLNINSLMGKQLDSLADMVSFGFLPAVIIYQLITESPQFHEGNELLKYSAFLIAIFSALRLAKFNIDTRQSESFIGLPTPSCALVILSIPYLIERGGIIGGAFQSLTGLVAITLILCYLLVAELPLLSLKFKSFSFSNNQYRYYLLITSIMFFIFLQFAAIPLIILIYIILSLIQSKTKKVINVN